jgi:hypothetical protein
MLNEDMFLQPAVSGEMFLILAKVHPFLKDLRAKLGDQQAFRNIELVGTRTKYARERLQLFLRRVEAMNKKRAEGK